MALYTGHDSRTTAKRKYRRQVLFASIGEAIRAHRERVDLSRAALGRACGVDEKSIEQAENGISVDVLLLVDIADHLDLQVDNFISVGWEAVEAE